MKLLFSLSYYLNIDHNFFNVFLVVIIAVDIILVLEKNCFLDIGEDDVMMLVPPLFAPKDVPENIV